MRGNKNSATEDELGKLHNLVTKSFTHIISSGLKAIKEAEDEKGGEDVEVMLFLDSKDINAAANWVHKNEITYLAPEHQKDSQLSKDLAEVKEKQSGKILKFTDKKREA